jgi:hypothetical protein
MNIDFLAPAGLIHFPFNRHESMDGIKFSWLSLPEDVRREIVRFLTEANPFEGALPDLPLLMMYGVAYI